MSIHIRLTTEFRRDKRVCGRVACPGMGRVRPDGAVVNGQDCQKPKRFSKVSLHDLTKPSTLPRER
jgi:hypothetical protein